MNIFQKIGALWQLWLFKLRVKEISMDAKLIGILKVIGYVAAIIGLAIGFIDVKITVLILAGISAIIKGAEIFTAATPNADDDAFVAEVKAILVKYGLLK